MERREFLVGCSVAAIATTVERGRDLLPLADRAPVVHTFSDRTRFESYVGRVFRVYDAQGRFREQLRLGAVRDSGYCCEQVDQFSLEWQGGNDVNLEEGIYYFTDQATAAFDLHVSRTGPTAYVSTFSLFRRDA